MMNQISILRHPKSIYNIGYWIPGVGVRVAEQNMGRMLRGVCIGCMETAANREVEWCSTSLLATLLPADTLATTTHTATTLHTALLSAEENAIIHVKISNIVSQKRLIRVIQ